MHSLFRAAVVMMGVLVVTRGGQAQGPAIAPGQESPAATNEERMVVLQKNVETLQAQLSAAQASNQQDDKLKQQVELLQKQIETQQKMIQLLMDQVKKGPSPGGADQKTQTQVATLQSRSQQAARRDLELSQAVDNINEHADAVERNGPRLPATLKELFLPSQTNESPLSIYGTFVGGYQLFPSERGEGKFFFDAIEPIFLLKLNDHIMLESELEFGTAEVHVGYAQADFIVNDWLTIVAGRFLTPFGYFNERLHPDWINKMPDFPLMDRQVALADSSLNGLQARGSTYLFCSPFKMEYSLYVANGFGLPGAAGLTDLADLGAIKDTSADTNPSMAFGSRLGLLVPEWGINVGFSEFFNRSYGEDQGTDINLWGFDVNFHKGNWDFRFEYAYQFEETTAFLDSNIRRKGLYAQIAYRDIKNLNKFLASTELVFRYSMERFKGIDPTALDLTAFESPLDVPVDRDQYAFGINYYIYPSLVVKFAYQINHERNDIDLKDNLFLAQLTWGF